MQAIGYIRRSTGKQELSPAAQRDAIEAWCRREGLQLVAVHEEGPKSGKLALDARPALAEALAGIEAGKAQALVVAKRDRAWRNMLLSATITERLKVVGARLLAADGVGNGDRPIDEFIATLADAQGVFERRTTAQRTSDAMMAWSRRGGYTGGRWARYGYAAGSPRPERKVDERAARMLKPVAEEAATVEQAKMLRATGLSLRAVARELVGRGRRSRTGRPFTAEQIRRMVR